PLVGCGTYADEHAAVSCTGIGEDIVRAVLGYRVAAAVVAGAGVAEAGGAALRAFAERTRGEAGVIVLDRHGALHHAHSAAAMPVAWIGADGALHTAA
ncbi:MAG: hypothetical protein GWO02_07780, partial [Gammaproteobacteria bacterium]|nr:hypothetical protein [Gammaproteobacteria bacterium]